MDCGKKTVKKRTVVEEERAQLFRDSKDTMAVGAGKEFKRHRSGTVDGIHVATGGAKAAVAAKGNELPFCAVGTVVHCTAERRVTAVNHFFNILNNRYGDVKYKSFLHNGLQR